VTTYYVSSVDGSNSDDGSTWALAKASLTELTAAGANGAIATANAAGAGPHLIYVDSAHAEALTSAATVTASQEMRIISVDRNGGATPPPLAGAVYGSQSTSYYVWLGTSSKLYLYGIEFRNGTGAAASIVVAPADGGHLEAEDCTFNCTATSTTSYTLIGNVGNVNASSYARLIRPVFVANATGSCNLVFGGKGDCEGGSLSGSAWASTAFAPSAANTGDNWRITGFDFTALDASATIVGEKDGSGISYYQLINCIFPASATIMGAQSAAKNKGSLTVEAFNCASGDTHYAMFHGDAVGTTTVSATIYANDGASYDGTNRCSWKIVTTADCSYYTPYVSPWIEMYNADVATSITPYLEGLRDGSATVIQDDEVWAEFSRQGTIGYPLAVFSNDRMALLGTPANQTSTLAAGDWTGEAGTYSTFKLSAPSAFTPAEIGPLKARVIVGEPSLTIYVDPQVRT
jgi:hypothetical protein